MNDSETAKPAGAHSSYRRILASTSIVGGAAAVNVLIGMVRSKVVAEFLGTEGFGEMGLYMSVSAVAVGIATFGLNISGVRELADAMGARDEARARSVRLTFWRLSWVLGLIGTLVMAGAAGVISRHTFESMNHGAGVAWLSLIVLISLLGNYWTGLVQVSGRMTRLGQIQVVGAVLGAIASISCFVVLRERGIVPALVLGTLVQMLSAGFWARDLGLPQPDSQTRWSAAEARRLLTIGGVSVLVGIQASLVGLLMRRLILGARGMEAVGIYQAAQALSMMYASYILGAMAADFLPRLTASLHDREAANRLINEQTVIALLLGLPGVVGTIVLAPWAIPFFYSSDFSGTVPVLQVMAVGVYGRLLAWPLGIALMAVDARRQWVLGELFCSTVQIVTAWALLPSLGVMATAVSLIAVSVVCSASYYLWVRRLTGLRWSREVMLAAGTGGLLILSALGAAFWLGQMQSLAVGAIILLLASWFSLRQLARSSGVTRVGLANRLLAFRGAICRRLGFTSK